MAKAEGKIIDWDGHERIAPELLETFPFDEPREVIFTETTEFSAVCPFSGLPDIATVRIWYKPTGGRCVELKSLKYYFISFRTVGIYQEEVTKRIWKDLSIALNTTSLRVQTAYNKRGGFDTICDIGDV